MRYTSRWTQLARPGPLWIDHCDSRRAPPPEAMTASHQQGGVCTTHGSACSTWAASAAASPRRRARSPASPRPAGRLGVWCVGSEIAGLPVTFHIEVYGVNRFCASKSAAGSSSSRIAPTGSGGVARVGVSTASYDESAASVRAATRRSSPIASPNSGPLTADPALGEPPGQRPEQRPLLLRAGYHRQRGEHRPAGLEDGDRVPREGHVDVDHLVAERLEQPAGVLPGRGCTRGRCRRRRSPARRTGRSAAGRARGRRHRGRTTPPPVPRTGRPPPVRPSRRAGPPRRGRCGRGSRWSRGRPGRRTSALRRSVPGSASARRSRSSSPGSGSSRRRRSPAPAGPARPRPRTPNLRSNRRPSATVSHGVTAGGAPSGSV